MNLGSPGGLSAIGYVPNIWSNDAFSIKIITKRLIGVAVTGSLFPLEEVHPPYYESAITKIKNINSGLLTAAVLFKSFAIRLLLSF